MKRMQPFSRGTEFMYWQERNCLQCTDYENESTEIEHAGCKLAFALDLASATDGMIDVDLLKIAGGETDLPKSCASLNEVLPF